MAACMCTSYSAAWTTGDSELDWLQVPGPYNAINPSQKSENFHTTSHTLLELHSYYGDQLLTHTLFLIACV